MTSKDARPAPRKGSLWLVTGGAGFLGRAVLRRLVAAGARGRSIDIVEPDEDGRIPGVEYRIVDIRDAAAVKEAMQGVDYVVHAAAALPIHRSRKFILDVNVGGTRNVLAAARDAKVKGVAFTSSTAVYGLHKYHPILEKSPMVPVGPYGESKVKSEELCRAYRHLGLHVAILRCKTFVGEGRLGVFEILFDWIRRGKRIYTIGRGNNRYQLLHVDDLIDAIVLAAQNPAGNDDFNLGADEFGTLRQDLTKVIEHAGTGARLAALPRRTSKFALFVLDKLRLSPLTRWHYGTMDRESYVEIDKAREKLGWSPKHSNVKMLIDAYDWYVANLERVRGRTGTSHTVAWDQKALRWLRGVS